LETQARTDFSRANKRCVTFTKGESLGAFPSWKKVKEALQTTTVSPGQ
jgi:hypothetical protein